MMDCARIVADQIMEKYLLDQLDDPEREQFENHFFECEECFARLEALQAAQRVLSEEPATTERSIVRPWRSRSWRWAVAAAAVAVIGLSAVWWWLGSSPRPQTVSLSPELAELARITPPHYEPIRLRGASDVAQRRFRTAMEFYSAGDYASAIPGLEEAAELDPDAPNISFFLGACYLLTGRTSEGITELERTIALGDTPYLEEAFLLMAKGRLATGDRIGAENAFEEAAKMNGDLRIEARDALAKLREVSGSL